MNNLNFSSSFRTTININIMSMSQNQSTPPPQAGGQFVNNGSGCTTPVQPHHKKLLSLLNGEPKSPFLRIPASPAMQRLGYGTGVGVYLMERSPKPSGEIRSPWAIKKISKIRECDPTLYKMRLEYEAEILRQLSHPNIIGYRAFGNPTIDTTFLAMEKASKSLADLIEERCDEQMPHEQTPFPATNIHKVAVDISSALMYLHEDKKIIHGDLKGGNVLIFGDFEMAKLCDFGVHRKIGEDGLIEGRYVGTEIWNPMEVILLSRGHKKYPVTFKADIYPFGLTLHEMISLKPPHFNTAEEDYVGSTCESDANNSEIEGQFDEEAFDIALAKQLGRRPALPVFDFDESYNTILGVFYCCTHEDPNDRPSAREIFKMLQKPDANNTD